jgi:hypothetical protein
MVGDLTDVIPQLGHKTPADSFTPLHLAFEKGDPKIVLLLMEKKCWENYSDGP